MQDAEIWNKITAHLSGQETQGEKEKFTTWLSESEANKILFEKLKNIWEVENSTVNLPLTFRGRFTWQKIKNFIFNQAIGNLIGFIVGMWVTASFSHYVTERRSVKNLFGLAGRKKVEVNDMPEWLQKGLAILIGFIVLELINHFFQTKKHLLIWKYLKGLGASKA